MYTVLEEEKRPCGKRAVKYVKVFCSFHKESFWIKENHYKSGSVSCKGCRSLGRLGNADNTRHIEELKKVNNNFIFCPNTTRWDYKCMVCDYEGSSYLDHLKSGKIGCRCSKNYRHTKEDRERQLAVIVSKDSTINSFSLIRYNTTLDSELEVDCDAHGKYYCTINNFINHGSRCPDCARELSTTGYYINKTEVTDYLYLMKLQSKDETFIKIGRSFNPTGRLRSINSYSGYHSEILLLFEDTHKSIFEKEKQGIIGFRKFKYIPDKNFAGYTECFTLEGESILKNYIEKLKQTLDKNPTSL